MTLRHKSERIEKKVTISPFTGGESGGKIPSVEKNIRAFRRPKPALDVVIVLGGRRPTVVLFLASAAFDSPESPSEFFGSVSGSPQQGRTAGRAPGGKERAGNTRPPPKNHVCSHRPMVPSVTWRRTLFRKEGSSVSPRLPAGRKGGAGRRAPAGPVFSPRKERQFQPPPGAVEKNQEA